MNWFKGQIPNAIQLAKTKNCIIVVYITSEDEKSKSIDTLWQDNEVISVFNSNEYVALKLQSDSESCKQFSLIYPVIVIPCTFLIAGNGNPLDVIGCDPNRSAFLEKVNSAFKKHLASKGNSSPINAREKNDQSTAASASTEEMAGAAGYTQSPSSSQLSHEERIRRAQEVIAAKRAERNVEEKEKAKKQELERRELGKTGAKFAQWKKDEDLKDMKKQWEKDKEADRLARERVREQIAQDRAEKSAAYERALETKKKEEKEKEEAKVESEEVRRAAEDEQRSAMARIQFRLMDGSAVNHTFPSTESLSAADAFISQHLGTRTGTLTLTTLYPRRSFTGENMGQTMAELGLNPTAVIMVTQRPNRVVAATTGPIYTLVAMVVTPFKQLWNFLYSFIFGSTSTVQPSRGFNSGRSSADSHGSRPHTRPGLRQRSPNTMSQTDGNIHRLSEPRDETNDDDDNATWNGNSTQQM